MITNSILTAETRMLLDEVTAKSWFDAEVQREINFAYHEFVSAVITTYEDFYRTFTTFNFVANQQEYGSVDGVPTDVFKVRRVETNYDVAKAPNNFIKSLPVDITQIRDQLGSSNFGGIRNSLYYVFGFDSSFTIGFVPTPTIDSTGGVKFWYIKNIANLSLSTDPVSIPYSDRYAKGISLIAASMLLRKGQQEEGASERYMLEGQNMKGQMMEELEDRIADDSKIITDTLGMSLDFSEPF